MQNILKPKSIEKDLLEGSGIELASVADAVKSKSNLEQVEEDIHDVSASRLPLY